MNRLSRGAMGAVLAVAAGVAGAGSALARDPARIVYVGDELAVTQIAQGQLSQAEDRLTPRFADDRQDPARLINLGIVYAKAGKADHARAAFAAVGRAPECDVILADGREMSSHLVARQQLALLDRSFAAR